MRHFYSEELAALHRSHIVVNTLGLDKMEPYTTDEGVKIVKINYKWN